MSKVQETQPNLLRPEQTLSAQNTQSSFTAYTDSAVFLCAGLQTSAIIKTQSCDDSILNPRKFFYIYIFLMYVLVLSNY